jgi:arylsulfatase A-like enzyme
MLEKTRREFLGNAGLGLAALSGVNLAAQEAGSETKKEQAVKKPNVVVILVDDLGYGDLGCYGAADLRTPHIDRMAAEGMRFTQFYANCPVCSPTRASLLTGRYPDLVGVPGVIRTHRDNSWGWLAQDAVLLPTVLKKEGYHSAIVGKWHLGLEAPDTPLDRGFDFFHGWLGDMMDDYFTHRRHGINYLRHNREAIDPEGHATDLFTQWACDYIEERTQTDKPFFLYLAYNAPHTPIQPPEDWREKVKAREKGIDEKRAKLAALIEHMDDGIGRVMQCIKDSGIDEDTLVIFVSDNGGQSNVGADNGPLRGGKQNMWEGGIRVPMCARWPGRIPEGTESDRLALTMDIFPAVAETCGASFDHEIEGASFLPTLKGEHQPADDRTLFWVRREGGHYGGRAYYAARQGDWKLEHSTPFEPMALYNLKDDPKEENPLPMRHPKYRELFDALRDHINRTGAIPWEPDTIVPERK